MKVLTALIVILFGALLVFCSLEFPPWGDPEAPASRHVSPRYIEKTIEETSVPNIVTAVLADYRGYDTMFETIVIFTAAVACLMLLRVFRKSQPHKAMYRHTPSGITLIFEDSDLLPKETGVFERIDSEWVPYSVVIKTSCRLIVPFSQIFALYVIAHGHHSPGGRVPRGGHSGGFHHSFCHIAHLADRDFTP